MSAEKSFIIHQKMILLSAVCLQFSFSQLDNASSDQAARIVQIRIRDSPRQLQSLPSRQYCLVAICFLFSSNFGNETGKSNKTKHCENASLCTFQIENVNPCPGANNLTIWVKTTLSREDYNCRKFEEKFQEQWFLQKNLDIW